MAVTKSFQSLLTLRSFRMVLKICLIFILIVLLLQGIFYYMVLTAAPDLENADLVVVFPGDRKRIASGFKLVNQGYAKTIFIPGQSRKSMIRLAGKNKFTKPVELDFYCQTRSTVDDAACIKTVINRHNYTSVILVTSKFHSPRALFVLKCMLHDSKTKLQVCRVNPRPGKPVDTVKVIVREMLEFWGSIFQLIRYFCKIV